MQKIFILFIVLFLCFQGNSQSQSTIIIDKSYGKLPFTAMAKQLKNQYSIDILFKEQWVENITTPELNNALLLPDFLKKTFVGTDMHAIRFQDFYVVIPGEDTNHNVETGSSSTIIVGNPLNKGRYSKAIVTGTVLDGSNQSTIPGAQVIVKDLSIAVGTNQHGKFSIELPTGNVQMRFAFMGLEDQTRDLIIYNDGEIEVELYEKSIALNEIDVTARRPEDNFRSTSMGMVKMSMKSMKKLSVLMGEPDIIKSMVLLPGVQSTGENASGFNVRGGNIDQNLIHIQEAPIFNTSHLFGLFSMFDPIVVKDVTLYKSGIPARYGGRIASVMGIELNKGNEHKLKVDGGIGIINSRISMQGPIGKKVNFIVGARSTYSDWMLKIMKDYELKNSSANFYDFNAKLDIDINQRNKISLFGYKSRDNFLYFENAGYDYGNIIGTAKWNHIFNNNNASTLVINSSFFDASTDDISQKNLEYNLFTSIWQQQVAYHFSSNTIARHKFNSGLKIKRYLIDPGKAKPYSAQSIIEESAMQNEQAFEGAAYLEDEFDLTPQVALIAGLRYSAFLLTGPDVINYYDEEMPRNELTFTHSETINQNEFSSFYHGIEPRIALRYELANNSSIKAGYNRNKQYIRQISNSASITPADFWKASDRYLEPLISDQYSAGFFKNFNKNMYETSFELYYKSISNEVDYKNGAQLVLNKQIEQALVYGKGRAYGAELLIKKSQGNLTGWLAYTYSRSMKKIDGKWDEERINSGRWYKSNYDKPHDFTLVMNYKISRRYTLSGNFTYSTGRPATYPERKYYFNNSEVISFSDRNKYRLPDYHRLDIAFTYEGSLLKKQKWRSSWTIALYNVYGHKNTFSVFYEKQKPTYSNNYKNYSLYKFAVIGVPIPSFTYNFWF